MTIFLIASAAALATTVLLVAGLLLARRSLVRDLSAALEQARQESRRAQALGELAVSLDLDEVVARTLEAARLLPGVEAATLRMTNGVAPPLEVADGPAAEGVGIVVPLTSGDEHVGQLAAYSRTGDGLDAARPDLEELARRAAPVLENARRFREARQLADLDALTGLHNQRFFHETLAREVARARRYGRSLALIVLDVDDFKLINDRIGHLAGDAVLAETAERILDVVRTADIACRIGGDEFAVILPEAGRSRSALRADLERGLGPAGRPGRTHPALRRRDRAAVGRCRGVALPARRRGALSRQGRRQGDRGRGGRAAAGGAPVARRAGLGRGRRVATTRGARGTAGTS
jgi:GGDEF domain-containing protein